MTRPILKMYQLSWYILHSGSIIVEQDCIALDYNSCVPISQTMAPTKVKQAHKYNCIVA